MPYLKKTDKSDLNQHLKFIIPKTAGEFNYCIFKLALNYLRIHGLSYQNLNDIEGALQNCSKEIYRRISKPYEKLKITDNGDVEEISDLLDKAIFISLMNQKKDDKDKD